MVAHTLASSAPVTSLAPFACVESRHLGPPPLSLLPRRALTLIQDYRRHPTRDGGSSTVENRIVFSVPEQLSGQLALFLFRLGMYMGKAMRIPRLPVVGSTQRLLSHVGLHWESMSMMGPSSKRDILGTRAQWNFRSSAALYADEARHVISSA
jgi:hypothetical protein